MCVEKLIKMVKSNPILYDTNNSEYKNVGMKEKIWQDIGEELGQDCEYMQLILLIALVAVVGTSWFRL